MRKINKYNQPGIFLIYLNSKNEEDPNYKPTFEGLDPNVKYDLQISLLNEQGWICGYCQQKIVDPSVMKIEHHCEQSICNGLNETNDRTLDYRNLMAVCYGIGGRDILHCDTSKAKFNVGNGLPIKVSPWIASHMNSIIYSSGGLVKSNIKTHDNEIDIILNLNAEHLKVERGKKFGLIYKNSQDKTGKFIKDKMKKILEDDFGKSGYKFNNSFPGLSEYMYNKYCK